MCRTGASAIKYPRTKATGKAGVNFVETVLTEHGSVFRPVHEESDVGIDGFIELVHSETASGRLVALQIKSGDSYLSASEDEFVVPVDERHVSYWQSYMVPVILICYSPSKNKAAWVSIRDYIEQERYYERLPIRRITVPLWKSFDAKAIENKITSLARIRADERFLLQCVDLCFGDDASVRRQGFAVLMSRPDARNSRTLYFLARRLISEADDYTAKDALQVL